MPKADLVKPAALALAALLATLDSASANICDAAAIRAARQTGVPTDVLRAITRLETGRGGGAEPWPWTVNHAGDGTWFKTEDEARSYVFSKVKQGASNLDIGCFQINYRWHSEAFRSLDEMFDPDRNAAYAALFLSQLFAEFGNWTEAAGAYHSRTPEFADRYKARFRTVQAQLEPHNAPAEGRAGTAWSFFAAGGRASTGSLFAAGASDARPLISFERSN